MRKLLILWTCCWSLNLSADRDRPDWVNYFIGLAFIVSRRSLDPNTKHGCLICTRTNQIIATGYNSFPRGMDDTSLPTNRSDPDNPSDLSKYDFIDGTHSERNAIANCMISPWLLGTGGAVAYVTGEPCNACLTALWQANVTTIYYADRHGSTLLNDHTRKVQKIIVEQTGMEFIQVKPDLSWVLDGLDEPTKLGFVPRMSVWVGGMLRILSRLNPTKGVANEQ